MFEMDIAFSVVIPLYNKANSILTTLESVLNQTYTNYEVIIVNDGSTDESVELVEALSNAKIKVYNQSNGGVSSARNFGVSCAKKNYIAFLDADDLWESTYLEEMKRLIEEFPDCGLYASAYYLKSSSGCKNQFADMKRGIVYEYFKTMRELTITWTSAIVVPTEVIQGKVQFPVGMIGGEDLFVWCVIAGKHPIAFNNKPLAYYNLMQSSLLSRLGKPDNSAQTWIDLYEEGDFYRNEFLAYKGIENGIRHALGGYKKQSLAAEKHYRYTRNNKKRWFLLAILNRLPFTLVKMILKYKRLKGR